MIRLASMYQYNDSLCQYIILVSYKRTVLPVLSDEDFNLVTETLLLHRPKNIK